jgi:hypothetical protein
MLHLTNEDIAVIRQKPVLKILFARAHAEAKVLAQRLRADPNFASNEDLMRLLETLDHVEALRVAMATPPRRRAKKARAQTSPEATAAP